MSHKDIRRSIFTKYTIGVESGDNKGFNLKNVLLESCFPHNNKVHNSTKKNPVDLKI